MSTTIQPRQRNYFKESQKYTIRNFKKLDARSHPLSLIYTTVIKDTSKTATKVTSTIGENAKKKQSNPLSDPLSDPLHNPLATSTATVTVSNITQKHKSDKKKFLNQNKTSTGGLAADQKKLRLQKEREGLPDNFQTWNDKRSEILKKYTSNTRISVTANFLDQKEDQDTTATENDQLKKKLEQLEMDKKEDKLFLSQTEYIKRMEHNVKRLRKAWADGKRVLSLKIAIQSAKLLCENSVNTCPQFFPSMFALVADILDSFGELVFERLAMKASSNPVVVNKNAKNKNKKKGTNTKGGNDDQKTTLRDNFTPVDINLEASETCQNWFYKIACIRELCPRLFIELSLFRCWRFIRDRTELLAVLKRLSMMIRGIGDPLVAAYARAYVVHVGFMVLKEKMRPIILETFDDFLFTFNELEKSQFRNILCIKKDKINKKDYIDLFTPCLDWIIQCIGYKANEEEFFGLVQRYKEGWNNSIILLHILAKFDDKYISKHAKGVSRLIKESFVTTVPRSNLYKQLGLAIVNVPPPQKIRLTLLNEIWKVVAKISDAKEYISVASVYVEYLLQHFGKKEIDILLGDVIKHLKKDLSFQELQDDVYKIVQHILKYMKDIKDLFQIMNFLTLIDMLQSTHKMSACKMILESFKRSNTLGISDPVMINSLMDVSRMLHDSIDYLTFYDEKRQITELICHLIDYIDYGHDLERQLNEYLECRAIFSNLDGVIYILCTKVGNLAMKAHKLMHGKHNKKTSAFVKACLAYCHVTIPSLELLWPRMYLFSNLGQIALTNQMIIQAEGFFKAAISLIPILPITFTAQYTNAVSSTAHKLYSYINTFTSTILLMPGHPTRGPFYLLEELMNCLEKWSPWSKDKITIEKTRTYLALFKIFCTASQREFPYNIRGVSSNDQLYGRNSKYLSECLKYINRIGKSIHKMLIELKNSQRNLDKNAASLIGLEFINILIDFVKLDNKSIKIISVVHNNVLMTSNLDKKFYNNTLQHIKMKNEMLYQQLIAANDNA